MREAIARAVGPRQKVRRTTYHFARRGRRAVKGDAGACRRDRARCEPGRTCPVRRRPGSGMQGLCGCSAACSSRRSLIDRRGHRRRRGGRSPPGPSYDHDGARSATDPDSGAPVTPTAAWGAAAQVDGDVYAQPLVYGSAVYVGTENDSVYALNAATGAVLWHRSRRDRGALVGQPATSSPAATSPRRWASPARPPSTPPAAASMRSPTCSAAARSTTSCSRWIPPPGPPVAGFPVAVDPPGSDHTAILQRASLALDGGRVIIPYGGNAGRLRHLPRVAGVGGRGRQRDAHHL